MESNVKQQIYDEIIIPYLEKKELFVGTEVEVFIYSNDAVMSPKEVGQLVLNNLIDNYGFHIATKGIDGSVIRVENDFDAISFDYSYQLLEFSMGKDFSLLNISNRFYQYYQVIWEFLYQNRYSIACMGTNQFRVRNVDESFYTQDVFYRMIRYYIQKYTYHKDPSYFFTMMASTQSHIDVNPKKFLKVFNTFNRLSFVRALLFSNSIPNSEIAQNYFSYPKGLLCARDFIWNNQGLPNVGLIDQYFENIDQLVEYISQLKIFIEDNNGKLCVFEPITIEQYLGDTSKGKRNLNTFRSFQHVALNKYHSIEVREDCTQPIQDVFAPVAFNLGLAEMIDRVEEVVSNFLKDNDINLTNSQLREQAILGKDIIENGIMKRFLMDLYLLAFEGLKRRNHSEEKLLECILLRIETRESPAKYMQRLLNQGISMEEITRDFSNIYNL